MAGLVLAITSSSGCNPGTALRDCRLHAAAAETPALERIERDVGARHAALIQALLSPCAFDRPMARQLVAAIARDHLSMPRSP